MKCFIHQDRDALGVCNRCGKSVCVDCAVSSGGEKYCKDCAAAKTSPNKTQEHSPVLALILSVIIPGAGQMYNGQIGKGIIIFISPLIAGVLGFVLGILMRSTGKAAVIAGIGFFLLATLVIYILGILDAYKTAAKIKRDALAVAQKPGCIIAFIIAIAAAFFGVALIGLLAAIAVPNFLRAHTQAHDTETATSKGGLNHE